MTSPTPQSPATGTTVSGVHPTLSVAMSVGEYVQAPGLQLGFAVWRMEDDGSLTLVEAEMVPQTDSTTTYAVGWALAHAAEYRWRARAVLNGAFGPWSNVATFRTPAPPHRRLHPARRCHRTRRPDTGRSSNQIGARRRIRRTIPTTRTTRR